MRHYAEALNVLAGIADRTARWYYYSAVAQAGMGNHAVSRIPIAAIVNIPPDSICDYITPCIYNSQIYDITLLKS